MALESDQAVVVRARRWSESSQIVTLFARRLGVLTLVAKGSFRRTRTGKGRFDGGLDLLDLGEAVLNHRPERELQQLIEWKLLDGHLPLRWSLRGIYLGLHAAELVPAVFEDGDPQPVLFDRLVRLVSRLHSRQREEMALGFTLDLLRRGGLVPELRRCVRTRRPLGDGGAYFSPREGGTLLPEAAEGVYDVMAVSADQLRLMRGLLQLLASPTPARLPRLSRAETDPLHRLLVAHLQHALGRRLRTPRFVLDAPDLEPAGLPA